MTRKDYELLSAVLKQYTAADNANWTHLESAGFEPPEKDRAMLQRTRLIVRDISSALANDNPRFNPDTFLKACGL
jgi:hypothetical protein